MKTANTTTRPTPPFHSLHFFQDKRTTIHFYNTLHVELLFTLDTVIVPHSVGSSLYTSSPLLRMLRFDLLHLLGVLHLVDLHLVLDLARGELQGARTLLVLVRPTKLKCLLQPRGCSISQFAR